MIKWVLTLLVAGTFAGAAQGVHLSAGETLSFGFSGVNGCHFTEAAPGSVVIVGFATDLLDPGESLRVELFENDLMELPFATETFSPGSAETGVYVAGPFSHWLDFQGLTKITMVGGSVDVLGGLFFVSPDRFTYCDRFIAVPEPSAAVLAGLGTLFAMIVWFSGRRRKG
jgi:hypothetical protein